MNKNVTLFALICASTTFVAHYAQAALVDLKLAIGVTTCTGANAQCNVTISAIGDVVEVDIKGAQIKDLGTINEERVKSLALPGTIGTYSIFSLTPSEGDLKGTKVFLLVQNQAQRAGTRQADMTVFKFSRQLPGDKPNEWKEVGEITLKKTEALSAWPFVIQKNGTLITFDTKDVKGTGSVKIDTTKPLPEGVKKVEMLVGNKELNPKS